MLFLLEFDLWYSESFLHGDEPKTSAEDGVGVRAGTLAPAGQSKTTTIVSDWRNYTANKTILDCSKLIVLKIICMKAQGDAPSNEVLP